MGATLHEYGDALETAEVVLSLVRVQVAAAKIGADITGCKAIAVGLAWKTRSSDDPLIAAVNRLAWAAAEVAESPADRSAWEVLDRTAWEVSMEAHMTLPTR